MMRGMSDDVRLSMSGGATCVISMTETTKITVPAGPEARD
jgi:hypothetical protein